MAKTAPAPESPVSLARAKVKRLVIRNFRCIGPSPVFIDLDDIVVLVGPNNVGKSTILRAYEVVMLHGTNGVRLTIDDFPNEQVDPNNLPEIELETYIFGDRPAAQWLHVEPDTGREFVRERWRWEGPGRDPVRQGHRATDNDWNDKVPWGAPGVANARRPRPHRVDAFASPEAQAEEIVDILRKALIDRASQPSSDEIPVLVQLSNQIKALQTRLVEESQDDIADIERSLTSYIGEIFVGVKVCIDTKQDQISEKAVNFFSMKPILRMGSGDGHMAPLDKQGSGARRTLLWSALKIVAEKVPETAKKTTRAKSTTDTSEDGPLSRPHVLLLDEPEICLHPTAIREACRVLYDLAAEGTGWQVMVTTHSPAFIDISRDNTTIVRVERASNGVVCGTTVFRPERVQLTEDDKEKLKLLNYWDPYFAEFFFGGSTVIVEGDTEYSAFREIMDSDRGRYRNVHVVRARGKFVIPALIKIMNHFGSKYAVLHDSDAPFLSNHKSNPAWSANAQIVKSIKPALALGNARLATCVPNFEKAVFYEETSKDKPYNAVQKIKANLVCRADVKAMLDYLIFGTDEVPSCLKPWDQIDGLRALFEAATSA